MGPPTALKLRKSCLRAFLQLWRLLARRKVDFTRTVCGVDYYMHGTRLSASVGARMPRFLRPVQLCPKACRQSKAARIIRACAEGGDLVRGSLIRFHKDLTHGKQKSFQVGHNLKVSRSALPLQCGRGSSRYAVAILPGAGRQSAAPACTWRRPGTGQRHNDSLTSAAADSN